VNNDYVLAALGLCSAIVVIKGNGASFLDDDARQPFSEGKQL
jgi:hypothetical protein